MTLEERAHCKRQVVQCLPEYFYPTSIYWPDHTLYNVKDTFSHKGLFIGFISTLYTLDWLRLENIFQRFVTSFGYVKSNFDA